MLRNPPHFLGQVKVAAEQLNIADRVKVIDWVIMNLGCLFWIMNNRTNWTDD
jgi:hypothetical protein